MDENLQHRDLVGQFRLNEQQASLRQIFQQGAQGCSPFVIVNPAPNSSPVVANATFERHTVTPE
jgi:hypothetical protein